MGFSNNYKLILIVKPKLLYHNIRTSFGHMSSSHVDQVRWNLIGKIEFHHEHELEAFDCLKIWCISWVSSTWCKFLIHKVKASFTEKLYCSFPMKWAQALHLKTLFLCWCNFLLKLKRYEETRLLKFELQRSVEKRLPSWEYFFFFWQHRRHLRV